MEPINFFKLQAKNLHRDYKTQTTYFDAEAGRDCYRYQPTFYDVDGIFLDFDIPEEKFTLMNAHHVIAKLAGFKKWTELAKATDTELQLSKLLFDNMHKVSAEEWMWYIFGVESDNQMKLDAETRLDIFQQVYANEEGHQSSQMDYRLRYEIIEIETTAEKKPKKAPAKKLSKKAKLSVKITSLPLNAKDKKMFIKTANEAFDEVLFRLDPEYPVLTRKLWNPEFYVDQIIMTPDKLPIDRDYALSLIEAFLVHHVMDLAEEAEIRASYLY